MDRKIKWQNGDRTLPGVSPLDNDVILTTELPPEGEKYLILVDPVTGETVDEIALSGCRTDGDVASIRLKGAAGSDLAYLFRPAAGTKIDPCAVRISNGFGYFRGGRRTYNLGETPALSVEDIKLYKVHVRGFTMNSALKEELRGTYEGLRKKLDYIKGLGFNAVELMPSYELDDTLKDDASGLVIEDKKNYWGYARENYYYSPREKYASGTNVCMEMHGLIRDMHKKGMLVIMEIYIPFDLPSFRITEILHFWRRVYHVDGFHVVGERVRPSLFAEDPALRTTYLIFDHLDEDDLLRDPLSKRHILLADNSFQDTGRHFLKSDEGQTAYFASAVLKNPPLWTPVNAMASVNGFTLMDAVSYNDRHNEANGEYNHDGCQDNISWNCGEEGPTRKKSVTDLRKKQVKNALAYIFLSQGVPMLNAGDERGNSQEGNNNAYCQDNPVGWTDWSRNTFASRLTDYVKKLIAFRDAHPILHSADRLREVDYRALGYPEVSLHGENAWFYGFDKDCRSIGFMYSGQYAALKYRTEPEDIYVACNSDWKAFAFALPAPSKGREWALVMTTEAKDGQEFVKELTALDDQKTYEAPARSVTVLVSRPAEKKAAEPKKTAEKKASGKAKPEKTAQKKTVKRKAKA